MGGGGKGAGVSPLARPCTAPFLTVTRNQPHCDPPVQLQDLVVDAQDRAFDAVVASVTPSQAESTQVSHGR